MLQGEYKMTKNTESVTLKLIFHKIKPHNPDS